MDEDTRRDVRDLVAEILAAGEKDFLRSCLLHGRDKAAEISMGAHPYAKAYRVARTLFADMIPANALTRKARQ